MALHTCYVKTKQIIITTLKSNNKSRDESNFDTHFTPRDTYRRPERNVEIYGTGIGYYPSKYPISIPIYTLVTAPEKYPVHWKMLDNRTRDKNRPSELEPTVTHKITCERHLFMTF